ncbi:double-strand break repair helicase AddA [Falsiroseomonas tokyonensis]|uniref:DNA 3'-5' helicase n=1 Tax=Falsiroseomonas tokyonensis TaxID=430521 RepID=A0ABV7BQP1_9PROT|nr:double-strand break repair helicase AddA [Falsiroseomonas tokyonensis]MBU8536977.1 double-strand break repair helicase AddA [Falsiroseomonas tokyonensis]
MSLTLTPRQEAEFEQARASDPAASAWVGASAGSGKTKVLTDRVLRLLLAPGTRPGAILCLTFTKAAAAEMAHRLARDLGRWAVEPEAKLAARLAALLGRAPDRQDLDAARGLFARVLDLPGGMRISTIHAFCQSLLRAFPLEAGLAPQFAVVEEADAAALLAEAREAVLASPAQGPALEALASLVPPDSFASLVRALDRDREKLGTALRETGSLPALCAAIGRHLGLPEAAHEAALVAAGAQGVDDQAVIAARLLQASRNVNDQARGTKLLDWLSLHPAERAARWADWVEILLTQEGTPRARMATKDVGPRQAECAEILRREGERVAAVEGARRASRLLAATRALLGLGAPVLEGYRARKQARGMLDYDDLILAARQVLRDPGSAWVLFKLDGGLDHVLLDEAQDSNPAQWGIAAALTEEFFAGAGAERRDPRARTIFAVGDVKQSIYAFQGADSAGFARWQRHFGQRLQALGEELRDVQLQVSFRSTAPVLALVDAVFAEGAARDGVVAPGETLRHRPDRIGHAGCVELWPMLDGAEGEPPPPWEVPETPAAATGADAQLAEAIAARIATWLDTGEMLPSRGRAMRAGDILVLVRKRSGGLLPRLVRALKERGVKVGGTDRIRLVEQIAVQDLLALADALLLPEDDLQLAAALKSPLIGLDDDQLLALAAGREGSLWRQLQLARGQATPEGEAADFLAGLMSRADVVTPHALFAEILGEHRGRAKLLARLGPDAADPVDEFLNAALDHGSRHPPSLQGFVAWLRRGGAEVKRDQEAAGDSVRIMTVHGAKGLQAPVVILPDTVAAGRDSTEVRWVMPEEGPPLPLWAPNRDHHAPAFTDLLASEKAARAAEEHRLLYVALTRAEDRLLVCGWQRKRPKSRDFPESCWYDLVAQGFSRLPTTELPLEAPPGLGFAATTLRRLDSRQEVPPVPDGRDTPPAAAADLPDWARRPAPPEVTLDALAPSAVPREETRETPAAAPHGAADPTGQRFRRGRLVHALLQHLPDRPPAEREAAAKTFLARRGQGLSEAEQAATLAEVMALLAAPDFAAAFGPDSLAEAPIAGQVGNRLVSGQVDRLLVAPDRVLVLDYKTNRPPPTEVSAVPALYLRQMAAYRAVLARAFPGRRVDCALVWTFGARLMPLPEGLLDAHAPGA